MAKEIKQFKRGITIFTNAVKRKWTADDIQSNDLLEQAMVFTDFKIEDEGRSRKRVCILDVYHPDYEFNATLIEKSPQLLDYLTRIFEARNKATSTQDLFNVLQIITEAQNQLDGTILIPKPIEENTQSKALGGSA